MKLAGMHRSISFAYGDAYLGAMRLSYNFVLQPFIFLFIAISLRSIALGMLKPLTLRSFDRLSFITFLTFLLSRTYKTISQMSTFRFFGSGITILQFSGSSTAGTQRGTSVDPAIT